jgi:endonuclease YncB( thermonuclease family)
VGSTPAGRSPLKTNAISQPFTINTRWRKVFGPTRYYAIVVTADGHDLNELLVSAGLARIYGTRTPLPDGRDSLTYLAHLHELENEARTAKRGAWGKAHQ